MLKLNVIQIFVAWKELKKDPSKSWYRKTIQCFINKEDWEDRGEKDWWRKWSGKVARLALKFTPPEPKKA